MKKLVENRKISDLQEHPKQAQFFSDLPESELRALADDIKKNGLVNPIEILPDGTIITGHQRVRAAKLLGLTTIRCWVRDDLATAGEKAVEERLITDNLNRRQLTPLDRARCFRRLRQLHHDKWGQVAVKGDLRDYLATQFGVSGRTLDRWDRVLDTPLPVQQAFSSGNLTLVLAGKVVDLLAEVQQKIADRIIAGENPTEVVKDYLPEKTNGKPIKTSVRQLTKALRVAKNDLGPHMESVELGPGTCDLQALQEGQKLIEELIEKYDDDDGSEELQKWIENLGQGW